MTRKRTHERGGVVLVRLDPVRGSEQGKTRPCVIVSEMKTVRASRAKPMYVIVPLTRSETLIGPLAPHLPTRAGGLPSDSVALCMHVRSVDPARVVGYVGRLAADDLDEIGKGLSLLFGTGA